MAVSTSVMVEAMIGWLKVVLVFWGVGLRGRSWSADVRRVREEAVVGRVMGRVREKTVMGETIWDGYGRVCGQHTRNMNICYGPFVGSASRLSEFGVQHIRWLFMCVINLFLCVYNMMQALVHVS